MKKLLGNSLASMDNVPFSIPTYIINLRKRTDRRTHVLEQFKGRTEFSLRIVEAFEQSRGPLALWVTIRHILQDLVTNDAEYVIIGEDDITFTEDYSKEHLLSCIQQAKEKEADVVLGGISWFDEAIQISDHLYWTNSFSATHFTIIFKKFIPALVNAAFHGSSADFKIASLTNNILFLHPFIAVQKDFGYSDATVQNNIEGRIDELFIRTNYRISALNFIKESYNKVLKDEVVDLTDQYFHNIIIPTYIINLPERTERLEHIKSQFADKPEFDITIIEACKHEVGALGLWLSIRKVIELAIKNDDDVIVISEDDHRFTEHYSKEHLLKNIIEAHDEGVCFLSGGTGKFNGAVPITKNRYWVEHCLSTQFVIIYKKFFRQILDHPYDEKIIADIAYSQMALNKMVLYPFISTQQDFGYSDITSIHTEVKDMVKNMFSQSSSKLKTIQDAYIKYQLKNNINTSEKAALNI